MRTIFAWTLVCLGVLAMGRNTLAEDAKPQAAETPLEVKMETLDGKEVNLAEKYKGQVVLLVNVASKCGLTPQYKPLQAMHAKYGEEGLAIVGVPCNQFGGQEPGSAKEISEFCQANYGVKFDMLGKVDVNGEKAVRPLQVSHVEGNEPQVCRPNHLELRKVPLQPPRATGGPLRPQGEARFARSHRGDRERAGGETVVPSAPAHLVGNPADDERHAAHSRGDIAGPGWLLFVWLPRNDRARCAQCNCLAYWLRRRGCRGACDGDAVGLGRRVVAPFKIA